MVDCMNDLNLYILNSKEIFNKTGSLYYDDFPLIEGFKKLSIEAIPIVWDEFEISENALILVRTPWDYPLKREKFEDFLEGLSRKNCRVFNSVEILKWNMNKNYMLELPHLGIPTVQTIVSDNFQLSDLKNFPIVVKPLVGASGRNTFLISDENDIDKASILLNTEVMIQPFVESIQTLGEYSYMFFGGKYSHCIVKRPKVGEFRIQAEHGGQYESYSPSESELADIYEIYKNTGREFHYLRIDVVHHNGRLEVMELEAIEPELFFRYANQISIDLFVQTIANSIL